MNRQLSRALVAKARTDGGILREADAVALLRRADAVRVLLDTGYWREELPGVLVAATAESASELKQLAALAWAPGSLLSHFDAARQDGIWVPDTESTWITAPWASGARSRDGLQVVRTRAFPLMARTLGHAWWTQPPRTIADLASHLSRKQLESVLLSAIRLEKATAVEVDAASLALAHRPGISVLRELTALWTAERESLLEDGLFADVCAVVPYGVTRQHVLTRRDGSVAARLDVAIAELMLGFEADGLFFHSTDSQIASDQRRDRWCLSRGWQTARFREGPLSDHDQVRREIHAIVEQRRRTLRAA